LEEKDEDEDGDGEQKGCQVPLQDMARENEHACENIVRMPSDYK
jgi:hypothetical protein